MFRAASLAGIGLLSALLGAAPPVEVIDTPEKVWADFDPRAEPLDIEVKKQWTENGGDYTEMYFTGMTEGSDKVRVYAIYAVPAGKNRVPGILHIHGGGQTASVRWARFWTERGYALLTFNWGGKWKDREKYTLWGNLKQGNHGEVKAMVQATEPSVRVSSWYLWTRISRRALTCLEKQPEVDPERLGIFGVSMGGTMVWPFAGIDRRVKAACAIYGVGWNTYPPEMDAVDPLAEDPKTRLWRATMEPEAYASRVKCPILFLSGTNDHHGKMDWAYRTLAAVTSEHRQAFSPHWRHHIAAGEDKDLPLWMDTWLKDGPAWPKAPQAEVTLDGYGVPRLRISPDSSPKIQRVRCFYAVENRNPVNRFWRTVDSTRQGDTYLASLPVLDASRPLFAFANVDYESGVCLSSSFVSVIPARLGPAKATDTSTLLIDDFKHGAVDWYTRSPATDPDYVEVPTFKVADGPDGKSGITSVQFAPLHTHKVGDPKWRGPDGARLQFQVFVRASRKLEVNLFEKEFARGSKTYIAVVPLKPTEGWQTITLAAEDFKTGRGEALANWRQLQMLEFDAGRDAGPGPIFTDIRWVQ
jgi:dienelactone hydrolase